MPLALKRTKFLAVVIFVSGIAIGLIAVPIWKQGVMAFAQSKFGELTYKCDHSMREHLIAKQQVGFDPSIQNVKRLEAAELALVDCQEYDLMRKRLILWGLTDNELSMMSLKAIEERASSLQRVVEIHEIRY